MMQRAQQQAKRSLQFVRLVTVLMAQVTNLSVHLTLLTTSGYMVLVKKPLSNVLTKVK
jgi:hypothetical protein